MASRESAVFYQSAFWRSMRSDCFKRDGNTCIVRGCGAKATHCDHIRRRPHSPVPTPCDSLDNLRSLCAEHDAQVAFDCIALGELDRAHTHALTARVAVDAAVTALAVALAASGHQPPG